MSDMAPKSCDCCVNQSFPVSELCCERFRTVLRLSGRSLGKQFLEAVGRKSLVEPGAVYNKSVPMVDECNAVDSVFMFGASMEDY